MSATNQYGNVWQGLSDESLLPPGMLEAVGKRLAESGPTTNEISLVKDNIIRSYKLSAPIYNASKF